MFVPIHDANDLRHIRLQMVTLGLIAANVIIYLTTAMDGLDSEAVLETVYGLGYIPAVANGHLDLAPALAIVPDAATYITYAFLHGGLLHLAGNMAFLWVFGDNVEDAMGHVRFLLFYLVCAAAAAMAHGFLYPFSEVPLIGASGAASGVVAAYLLLHPRVRLWVLVFGRIPVPVPAYLALIAWIAYQFGMLVIDIGGEVSWAAHAGGIVAGLVLLPLMKRRDVPLFDRRIVRPRAVTVVPAIRRDV